MAVWLELWNGSWLTWVHAFAMRVALGVLNLSAPSSLTWKVKIKFVKFFINIAVAFPTDIHKYCPWPSLAVFSPTNPSHHALGKLHCLLLPVASSYSPTSVRTSPAAPHQPQKGWLSLPPPNRGRHEIKAWMCICECHITLCVTAADLLQLVCLSHACLRILFHLILLMNLPGRYHFCHWKMNKPKVQQCWITCPNRSMWQPWGWTFYQSLPFFSSTRSYITKCICFRNNNSELCYIEAYYSIGIVPDTFHELTYTHPVR